MYVVAPNELTTSIAVVLTIGESWCVTGALYFGRKQY